MSIIDNNFKEIILMLFEIGVNNFAISFLLCISFYFLYIYLYLKFYELWHFLYLA